MPVGSPPSARGRRGWERHMQGAGADAPGGESMSSGERKNPGGLSRTLHVLCCKEMICQSVSAQERTETQTGPCLTLYPNISSSTRYSINTQ